MFLFPLPRRGGVEEIACGWPSRWLEFWRCLRLDCRGFSLLHPELIDPRFLQARVKRGEMLRQVRGQRHTGA